jgi:dsRNA-specific ribonuclease
MNYRGLVNEYFQKKNSKPVYIISERGEGVEKEFSAYIMINKIMHGGEWCKTKKLAEESVAKKCCLELNKFDDSDFLTKKGIKEVSKMCGVLDEAYLLVAFTGKPNKDCDYTFDDLKLIGDSVLRLALTELLLEKKEKEITLKRSEMEKRENVAKVMFKTKMNQYFGSKFGRDSTTSCANVLLAWIGAIHTSLTYIDSKEFIQNIFEL